MNTRTWLILGIVLVLIWGAGLFEVFYLQKKYAQMQADCQRMIELCQEESATVGDYQQVFQKWSKLKKTTELMLPHVDTYELHLRFSECYSYIVEKDFKNAEAQLCVAKDLLEYIPEMTKPTLRNVA